MPNPSQCFVTENLGEVNALEACLQHKTDIQVKVGTWRWSEPSPWPPLSSVLKTPLWTSPWYEEIRAQLLRPLPKTDIIVGGSFLAVDTRDKSTSVTQQQSAPEEEESEHEIEEIPQPGLEPVYCVHGLCCPVQRMTLPSLLLFENTCSHVFAPLVKSSLFLSGNRVFCH